MFSAGFSVGARKPQFFSPSAPSVGFAAGKAAGLSAVFSAGKAAGLCVGIRKWQMDWTLGFEVKIQDFFPNRPFLGTQ